MKKLLVSVSGGETSMFMAKWLKDHKVNEFEMIFVFANTGQENEETLQFIEQCDKEFNLGVVWLEALVYHGQRKSNGFTITNYINADRDGNVFEDVIKKHGIPNQAFPHCTRELKLAPIKSYAKSLGWKNYYTAIGIRSDEIDRISSSYQKNKLLYPLISMQKMTKPMINLWWSQQKFRLGLKGYQGNCITCWKKSLPKLYQIAKENPHAFNFMGKMELRYGRFTPKSREKIMIAKGDLPWNYYPLVFFRGKKSAIDILKESENFNGTIKNDATNYYCARKQPEQLELDLVGGESCEIYAECGN